MRSPHIYWIHHLCYWLSSVRYQPCSERRITHHAFWLTLLRAVCVHSRLDSQLILIDDHRQIDDQIDNTTTYFSASNSKFLLSHRVSGFKFARICVFFLREERGRRRSLGSNYARATVPWMTKSWSVLLARLRSYSDRPTEKRAMTICVVRRAFGLVLVWEESWRARLTTRCGRCVKAFRDLIPRKASLC